MVSIRRRKWHNAAGDHETFVVDFVHVETGKRHLLTCKTERIAELYKAAFEAVRNLEVKERGTTTPAETYAKPEPIRALPPEKQREITPFKGELLWGAEEIGAAIGRTSRQAFYLLENGIVPARKVGGQWVAERQTLLTALAS